MFKYLKKPYPLIIEDGYLFPSLIDLLIGLVVFSVLFLFEPKLFFDPAPRYTFINCAVFGFIAFTVAIIHTNVLPRIFTSFFTTKNWTVGKEFGIQASIVLTIAIVNYFVYLLLLNSSVSFDLNILFQMLLSTLVIAFVPLMIVTIILQRHNFKKMMKSSGELNSVIQSSQNTKSSSLLSFQGEGKNENLELIASSIIYIESSANYCDICYLEDSIITKKTLRISLASIYSQLINHPSFIKTHRSYIVNVNHIVGVSGNAQGYQLTLSQLESFSIPVSRANVAKLNNRLQK